MIEDDDKLHQFKTGFMSLEDSEILDRLPQVGRRSLLKTTEWGLLTIASLLSSFAFPPYFMAVMTLAFLNAGGLLWVTHLSEQGRQRIREFERDFRLGHEFEAEGHWVEAVGVYLTIKPRYKDVAQLVTLCEKRIELIRREHSEYFPVKPAPAKKKKKKKS